MQARDIPQKSAFQHWTQETCRYGDTDRQGHVNNAVFATFFESGRVAFLRLGEPRLIGVDRELVIARLTIDFRREMQWRDVIDIGTTVLRLGNTSMTVLQGLFRGDECVASSESVLVLMDTHTRAATALPAELRQRLVAGSDMLRGS